MNYWLVLLVVVVVVFMFSGGKVEKVPAKLKSSAKSLTSGNKMVVGILVGLALCWFLGNGLVEKPLNVSANMFSKKSIEKIESAGGKVNFI